MKMRALIVAAGLACAAVGAGTGAAPELSFIQKAREVGAAHKDIVTLSSMGLSRQGRELVVMRLAAAGDVKPEDRPALVIVAGLDGRHLVGCEAALGVADKLAAENAELLKRCTVYVVPAANPDALAWTLDGGHPKTDYGRTISPYDADHDGRVEEDPGEDLDGDGAILTMRVKNPAPGSGLRAEYMIDPDNPRLLKKADATKGERAEYALLVEGRDKDGDGKFSEDGIGGTGGGGVDLNMNFPYRWPEFSDGAGKYELCEPESLAMVKWMLATPNVAAVLSYGPGDTILNVPEAGRFDPTNQVPLGIENADKPYWDEVAKVFKDATKQTGAPTAESAGSFQEWCYAVYGSFSFSTPVWVRPDQVKKEEAKKPTPAGGEEGDKKEDGKDEPKAEDAKPTVESLIERFKSADANGRRALFNEMRSLSDEDQAKVRDALRDVIGAGGPSGGGGGGGGRRGGGGQGAAQPPAGQQPPTPAPTGGGGRPGGGGQPPAGGGGGRRGGGRGAGGGGGGPGGRGPGGGAGGAGGGGGRRPGEPSGDDAKWLKYSDDVVAAGGKAGFVDWHAFKHPQLGEVEIGGFLPGFKQNPPEAEVERLAGEQAKFAVALLGKLPDVHAAEPVVEKLGEGVWRITVRVVNDGFLPSAAEIENKARRGLPTLVTIDLPLERLISGEKHNRAWVIAGSGGRAEYQWTVSGKSGEKVGFKVRPNIGPAKTLEVELKEAGR